MVMSEYWKVYNKNRNRSYVCVLDHELLQIRDGMRSRHWISSKYLSLATKILRWNAPFKTFKTLRKSGLNKVGGYEQRIWKSKVVKGKRGIKPEAPERGVPLYSHKPGQSSFFCLHSSYILPLRLLFFIPPPLSIFSSFIFFVSSFTLQSLFPPGVDACVIDAQTPNHLNDVTTAFRPSFFARAIFQTCPITRRNEFLNLLDGYGSLLWLQAKAGKNTL